MKIENKKVKQKKKLLENKTEYLD